MRKKWFRALFAQRVWVALLIILQAAFFIHLISTGSAVSRRLNHLLTGLSLVASLYIIAKKDKGAYKLTWVFLILLFPVFGGALYLLYTFQTSTRRFEKSVNKVEEHIRPLYSLPQDGYQKANERLPHRASQIRYLQNFAGFPVYDQTRTAYYSPGEAFFEALIPDLESAEHYIFLEFFIVQLLCKVLYMIAYPIQHDAQDSSIPQEHAPLPANAVCRLRITRRASREDGYYRDYEASFDKCLHEYESRRRYIFDSQLNTRTACRHVPQPDPKEFEILTRHAQQGKKSQLEEVIEKFNEHYAGEITQGDRILAGILMEKMSQDDILRKSAQQDGQQIFVNSVFSKVYDKTAMDSYKESREVFGMLFSDPKKYAALKNALAEIMYRSFRQN